MKYTQFKTNLENKLQDIQAKCGLKSEIAMLHVEEGRESKGQVYTSCQCCVVPKSRRAKEISSVRRLNQTNDLGRANTLARQHLPCCTALARL